ncbi:uncharacterized protein LOC135819972 [Sycon ciliatum]|uniref:uncharacterized protein LOC135819972 n=1 Tax=Sycon ciliatum TaxID=27933 RepID=UPI0031F70D01
MNKKDGSIVMACMVYMPNLIDIVMRYLDLYDTYGWLTWHGNVTPESEIWLKLGGDHGGHSFKFVFQVANLKHPNSLNNTIPLCVFDCQDSPANLQIALGVYADQVKELRSTIKWKGKSFVLFFFGDYDYQTKCYGLSGSSGYCPCLHCLYPKKQMEHPADKRDAGDH